MCRVFSAHRRSALQILALRSSHFRNLLDKRNKDAPKPGAELVLDEAPYAVVHAILKYCYKPYHMTELTPEQLSQAEALNADMLGVQAYVLAKWGG